MSSSYRKGADSERRLRGRLWDEGWAVAREAGSGSWHMPSADIWAVKDGKVLIIEVATVRPDATDITSFVDVSQLEEIYDRAKGMDNVKVLAVFRIPQNEIEWVYEEVPIRISKDIGDLDYLFKLLNRVDEV